MKRALLLLVTIALAFTFSACTEDEPSKKLMSDQINEIVEKDLKQASLPVYAKAEVTEVLDKYKDGDRTVMNVKIKNTMTMSSQEFKEKAAQDFPGGRMAADMTTAIVIETHGGEWDKGHYVEEEANLVFAKTEKSWKLVDVAQ